MQESMSIIPDVADGRRDLLDPYAGNALWELRGFEVGLSLYSVCQTAHPKFVDIIPTWSLFARIL